MTSTDDKKRRRLKAHYVQCDRIRVERKALERAAHEQWIDRIAMGGPLHVRPPPPTLPDYPAFPDDLLDLTCRACTRAGTPCKQHTLYANGRCKFHGGLSTGPRTAEGKARAASNGNEPNRKRTP